MEKRKETILVVDFGTTNVKAAIVELSGGNIPYTAKKANE